MKSQRSHFQFDKNQRSGILFLCLIIVGSLVFLKFYEPTSRESIDVTSDEIIAIQTQIDSLRMIALEDRKPKVFPFNPNFISDYKAYNLGMSTEEFNRLKIFRDSNQWINSVSDFKRVTQINDSLLAEISPLLKFPDWVGKSKSKSKNEIENNKYEDYNKELPFAQKKDLNNATAEELQKISGIGPALSDRIINKRKDLGGFSNDQQLYTVWGLDEAVVIRTLNQFTVKHPKVISKINVNTASASDIATVPGIPFELAKSIWEFRILREKITNLSQLENIEGMSISKFKLIQLYLAVD